MRAADILKAKGRAVRTVHSWTQAAAAVRLLIGPPPIGALVVSDDGHGHVAGMITERDIIRGLRILGPQALNRPVSALMSRHHIAVCAPHDTLAQVMNTMTRFHQRHLPVVENGTLCGIVSIGDVVDHRLVEIQLETNVLRDMHAARRT
jgi:CBS domain-containing protein